jgi:hypothetical protein
LPADKQLVAQITYEHHPQVVARGFLGLVGPEQADQRLAGVAVLLLDR